MDVIKGTIKNINTKTGKSETGEWTLKIIELEDGSTHSTFEKLPEDWADGKEIEFNRVMNGDYSNIVFKKPKSEATAEAVEAKIIPKFEELIKLLTMPRISVGFERTIQENQFEPKKVSAHITMTMEEINPKKITAMMKIAEAEVMAKINESIKIKEDKERELNKELDKRIVAANESKESLIEKAVQKVEQEEKDVKSFM